MQHKKYLLSRRHFLQAGFAGLSGLLLSGPGQLLAGPKNIFKKAIPVSGEQLPVIGLGTSRTFDVNTGAESIKNLQPIMQTFFRMGGGLIDSSPMYGTAEEVVGALLAKIKNKQALFAATKVWTDGRQSGIEQMNRSMQLMGVKNMDLMQIHNLRDWQTHLPVLREWKQQGRIRYIGITTSHGRYHAELENILKKEQFDFVQFSYNIEDRETEKRLLPLARDKGIATLINRPYQRGWLFQRVKGKALPGWVKEFDCTSWGQFFLKFITSHPDVTCVIPATSKLKHMQDNMQAGYGRLPDTAMRKRMLDYFSGL